MVGRDLLYGTAALQDATPLTLGCEGVDTCGKDKFVCVTEDTPADKLGQT